MKILGEAMSGLGRWYLAIPPFFLIIFLVGLFLLATAGQTRLESVNERVRISQQREQALGDFIALMTDADSAQRGYLITGEASYLLPYQQALPKIEPTLDKVREAYASSNMALPQRRTLRVLAGEKLGELESAAALAQSQGTARALELIRTDVGEKTMTQIRAIVADLKQQEQAELAEATYRLHSDLRLSRWLTAVGAALNVALVFLAARLVFLDMRRRERQASDLQFQKSELERQVHERTHDLAALSTHLQEISEQEKSALSRELHDELGGLLVSARMDLSWLQQRMPSNDPVIQQRFKRIQESLSAGVDLKRRVVEELRPTLLDNMGLFSALRWQIKESCARAGLRSTERYPDEEMQFTPHAAIGVFRMVQEALTNIMKHANAKSVDVTVEIDADELAIRIADDGKGIPAQRLSAIGSHGLASMRHRITALGGLWDIRSQSSGGTVVTARVPLVKILQTPEAIELQNAEIT
jgi:signal transduction histidine kinase